MAVGKLTASGSRQAIDEAEVRRWLPLIGHGLGVQFFGITAREKPEPSPCRWTNRLAGDTEGLLADLHSLAEFRSVYWVVNPLPVGLTCRANASLVLSRVQLLIDIDSVRPDKKVTNATAAEKAAALEVVNAARKDLAEDGWPWPVLIDSGNGYYLLYRLALSNTEVVRLVLKATLLALAKRFDTPGATIDPVVFNADRIARVPGTWNQKGPGEGDRPHYPCRVLEVPDRIETVAWGHLLSTAGLADVPPGEQEKATRQKCSDYRPKTAEGPVMGIPVTGTSPPKVKQSLQKLIATPALTAEDRAVAYLDTVRPGIQGQYGSNPTMWAARAMVWGFELGEEGGLALLLAHYNQRCVPPWSEEELRHKCEDANKAEGFSHERGWLLRQERPAVPAEFARVTTNGRHPGNGAAIDEGPLTIGADEIEPKQVKWLWQDVLPLGKAVTWAGQTSVGKSFLLMELAARLSVGGPIPLATDGECFEPSGTLILNTEDDYADTLVPRLIEAGGDLPNIHFLRTDKLAYWTLVHLDMLERAIAEVRNCRLVVIDPASAHLGGVDDHKNADLRQLLMPLILRLQDWPVCVVFVTHFNKAGSGQVETLSRVMGSVAWVAAVRCAAAFVPAPTDGDKGRRLFVPLKNNNGVLPQAYAYRILPSGDCRARVEWIERVDVTADEAMEKARPVGRPRTRDAGGWLFELFGDRRAVPSREIFDKAKEAGISSNALKEAKQTLGITARQTPVNGRIAWVWELSLPPPTSP